MTMEKATYSGSLVVVRLYRELLRHAKSLPEAQRAAAVEQTRTGFRNHVHETDPAKIDEFLRFAESKLSYMKVVTPKRPTAGVSSFVMGKDGELREGKTSINGRTLRAGIDPEDLARHRHLLERQHFMNR